MGRAVASDVLLGQSVVLGLSESQPLVMSEEHNPEVLDIVLDHELL